MNKFIIIMALILTSILSANEKNLTKEIRLWPIYKQNLIVQEGLQQTIEFMEKVYNTQITFDKTIPKLIIEAKNKDTLKEIVQSMKRTNDFYSKQISLSLFLIQINLNKKYKNGFDEEKIREIIQKYENNKNKEKGHQLLILKNSLAKFGTVNFLLNPQLLFENNVPTFFKDHNYNLIGALMTHDNTTISTGYNLNFKFSMSNDKIVKGNKNSNFLLKNRKTTLLSGMYRNLLKTNPTYIAEIVTAKIILKKDH